MNSKVTDMGGYTCKTCPHHVMTMGKITLHEKHTLTARPLLYEKKTRVISNSGNIGP